MAEVISVARLKRSLPSAVIRSHPWSYISSPPRKSFSCSFPAKLYPETRMNGVTTSKKYNIPTQETAPRPYNHINGSAEEILARFCLAELCQCWPIYRDASEWRNYRDAFTDDARVFTSESHCPCRFWPIVQSLSLTARTARTAWSGGLQIDDFIETSQKGRSAGDFIMHRVNGVLVDLNLAQGRAVGKMKATITQRFTIDGIPCDVDCDNRFIFFCKKIGDSWKTQWVKLFYEKDKLVPVDGKTVPHFPPEELAKYTEGKLILRWAFGGVGCQISRLTQINRISIPSCRSGQAWPPYTE